jgi:hypothetical protein
MPLIRTAVLISACLLATASLAQSVPTTTRVSLNPPPGLEATCIANGDFHREGARVCVRSAYGPQLATCGRVQNVLNWELSGTPCESATPRN